MTLLPDTTRPSGTGLPNQTTVTVTLTGFGSTPQPVTLRAEGIADSGGHVAAQHASPRVVGSFQPASGTAVVQPDGTQRFIATYTASQIGGEDRIVAQAGGVEGSARLAVRVRPLLLLPDSALFDKVGGTPRHPGPINGERVPPDQDANHWGAPDVVQRFPGIAARYRKQFPDPVRVNDMSLPFGGKFDLNGTWDVELENHKGHRIGEHMDLVIQLSDRPGIPQGNQNVLEDIIKIFFPNARVLVHGTGRDIHFHVNFTGRDVP